MNIIDERDKRTKNRKKAKEKFDRAINLAVAEDLNGKKCTLSLAKSEGNVRLLDEGAIVTASGDMDIYIKKGTIRKYFNGKNKKLTPEYLYGDYADRYFEDVEEPFNLSDGYKGSINIGHHDFATFPFIVGEWTKSDLAVTNNGDGRHGLDVDVKLNEMHPLVQALRVQGIPVGVSVEMWLHVDDKATEELSEKQGDYIPVVDEIFISDFAIVGECGNVGSSDTIDFEGVEMDGKKIVTEEVTEEVQTEDTITEIPEGEIEVAETEESEEPEVEEAEESEETEDKEDETAEEVAEENIEETNADEVETEDGEDEESESEEDNSETVLKAIESLKKEVENLKEENTALRQKNKKLSKKLKAKAEADEKFMEKFQGLEVSLGEQKEEKKEEVIDSLYANGDGRGVL